MISLYLYQCIHFLNEIKFVQTKFNYDQTDELTSSFSGVKI